MRLKLLVAAVALVAAVVVAVQLQQDPETGATGSFPLTVEADEVLFEGHIAAENATALDVLLLAGEQAGFDVVVEGSGEQAFVTRIGQHSNSGNGGWCYAVWKDGWVHPARSAGVAALDPGQAVRWSFEDGGCGTLA